MPPVGKSGPGMIFIRSSSGVSGSATRAKVASITSVGLCGGRLHAMPTAIPVAPLTSKLGSAAGSTLGSVSVSSKLGKKSTVNSEQSTEIGHGAVIIAAITSCTNTSNPSVMLAAGLLAQKAVARGLTTKPWVKTSLAPGSKVVTEYLAKAGLSSLDLKVDLQDTTEYRTWAEIAQQNLAELFSRAESAKLDRKQVVVDAVLTLAAAGRM